MGNTHTFCPAVKKAGRESEARMSMCPLGLHTPCFALCHAHGYEMHWACSCCPHSRHLGGLCEDCALRPLSQDDGSPWEAGTYKGATAGREGAPRAPAAGEHQVFCTPGSFVMDWQEHPGLPWSLGRGPGRATTALPRTPTFLHLILLPEL